MLSRDIGAFDSASAERPWRRRVVVAASSVPRRFPIPRQRLGRKRNPGWFIQFLGPAAYDPLVGERPWLPVPLHSSQTSPAHPHLSKRIPSRKQGGFRTSLVL